MRACDYSLGTTFAMIRDVSWAIRIGQVRGVADDPTLRRKMERAPLASYFFLALLVSRAFATKASNRGSL
jgi:hypothetical protein